MPILTFFWIGISGERVTCVVAITNNLSSRKKIRVEKLSPRIDNFYFRVNNIEYSLVSIWKIYSQKKQENPKWNIERGLWVTDK